MDNADVEIRDMIKILKKCINNAKELRERANKYCEQMASIMDDLESVTGRKMLAEIMQKNYKQMIELDIKISLMEEELKKNISVEV